MNDQKLTKKERKALKKQQANAVVNAATAVIEGTDPAAVTPVQQMLALPEATGTDIVIVEPKQEQGNASQKAKPSVKELMAQITPPEYIDPSWYITAEFADEMRLLGPTPGQLEFLMESYNNMITEINGLRKINYQTAGYIVGLEAEFDLEKMTRENAQRQLPAKDKQIKKLEGDLDAIVQTLNQTADESSVEIRRLTGMIKMTKGIVIISLAVGAVGFVMGIGALIALSVIR